MFCLRTILQILPNFLKKSSMSCWLKLKLSGMEILSIPTDSLQFFSSLQIMRYTELFFSTSAVLSSLKRSSGLSEDSQSQEDELSLSESSLRLLELFLFIAIINYPQMSCQLIQYIHFTMTNKEEEEIDPSIYQYDQIYDQIKGNEHKDKGRERSRSREKKKQQEKPKESRYINKMKQIVSNRQKDHELAYQKKIKRDNQKLGVNDDMVFVTESFLKKKQEEKEAARLRKLEDEASIRDAPEKLDYTNFKKKMLDQATNLYKK